jgi:putative Mg2+ transporter-C (MgtC) family protein
MIDSAIWELFARLLLASVCGAIIGLNRDLHKKAAGVRTFGLVSTGSAVAALLMVQTSTDPNAVSRVVQGVLTGIGFLGAGMILHEPTSRRVTGLTTAAAIWLTAGLGLACGLGKFPLALAALAVALLIITIGRPLERYAEKCLGRSDAQESRSDPDADG